MCLRFVTSKNTRGKLLFSYKQGFSAMEETENNEVQTIIEGLATVKTIGKVFYNPVQEFNRDLSISALTVFAKTFKDERKGRKSFKVNVVVQPEDSKVQPGVACEEGITILEALSATGLRSIRYAKEISGIKQIVANDISVRAVDSIIKNVEDNGVGELVTTSQSDAIMLMYQHRRENRFDAIDLDPYGCPSIFLDSAVQAINDGGLLLVTATDMAVLAGNAAETCYSKYGSISLRLKSCHEMALRILLQCIESHANRYGRYIVPMLSVSADFYIRVFVKIYTGPVKCKQTTSKLSLVYHCTGCGTFTLQPLGVLKKHDNSEQIKFGLPTGPPVGPKCEHCQSPHHIGGPIWSGPLHSRDFVNMILHTAPQTLGTFKRVKGVLNVILEELDDCPLYYTLQKLTTTLHVEMPPMLTLRSAILNAGHRVSYTHMHPMSIKTDAPARVIWDIMRCWAKTHPVNKKRLIQNTPAFNIVAVEPEKEHSFERHPDANPQSRKQGFVRFQENPLPHWGPGTRATAMVGDAKIAKSKVNQGKRKRDDSADNMEVNK